MEISSSPNLSDSSSCCFGALAMFPPPNTCTFFLFNCFYLLPWQCLHNYVHRHNLTSITISLLALELSFLYTFFLIIVIHGFFMPLYNMTVERDESCGKERGLMNVKGWRWHDQLVKMAYTTQPIMHFVYFFFVVDLAVCLLIHLSIYLFIHLFTYFTNDAN